MSGDQWADAINAHYGDPELAQRILGALEAAGRDPERFARDDLTGFDEFHSGGRASTRALARLATASAGERVLDVGCGIGGPARTLAAEFGCDVTGVDITESFVAAARMITSRLAMDATVRFELASATELPFEEACFDLAWSQNAIMNVADKARCFAEMARVLRPGGRLALELNAGIAGMQPFYPTFWADTAALSHMATREQVEDLLDAAGFTIEKVEDLTEQAIATAQKRAGASGAAKPDPLGMHVLVRRQLAEKFANGQRNFREGCTRALQVVARLG